MDECRKELKQNDIDSKAMAVTKLTYVCLPFRCTIEDLTDLTAANARLRRELGRLPRAPLQILFFILTTSLLDP